MPTKKTSAPRSKKSARRSKRTALGKRLEAAALEAASYLRGAGPELRSYTIEVPDEIDAARIRARLNLSQSEFARTFGLDLAAVQAWEQGRRRPDRAARILLAVINREPQAVMRALAAE